MMHEDIKVPLDRITIARGKIGEAHVGRELRLVIWGNRICVGVLGLALVLISTIIIRWAMQ